MFQGYQFLPSLPTLVGLDLTVQPFRKTGFLLKNTLSYDTLGSYG
jgi:hypothetical protein